MKPRRRKIKPRNPYARLFSEGESGARPRSQVHKSKKLYNRKLKSNEDFY